MVKCIVCGEEASPKFFKEFHSSPMHYCLCGECGHLTATPIDRSTDYDGDEYFKDVDYGWESRNAKILEIIRFLFRLPGIDLN